VRQRRVARSRVVSLARVSKTRGRRRRVVDRPRLRVRSPSSGEDRDRTRSADRGARIGL